MPTKDEMRLYVRERLPEASALLNSCLAGQDIDSLQDVLVRLGRGRRIPHWFEQLRADGTLPNLDGKTIGSVLEMMFVAVLETHILTGEYATQLRINPASGVDLPDLDIGLKTPSENFCTSEPFFSAYERLHGTEYDMVAMLTDYQTAKSHPPLRLRVIDPAYLTKTQIADRNLCSIVRRHREQLIQDNESQAKKVVRFLAHINQSDWRAKWLLKLVDQMYDPRQVLSILDSLERHFETENKKRASESKELLPTEDLVALTSIRGVQPLSLGIMNAADNWVIETHKEFGRLPNDNEWNRIKDGPLDGTIGMSFALQWRFNFQKVFRRLSEAD